MDIYAALDLIRLAYNHQEDYNKHTRKSLLNGIYELADSCIAAIRKGIIAACGSEAVFSDIRDAG